MQQERIVNRDRRLLADGQKKIEDTIAETQEQYLKEEKEMETGFQQQVDVIEAAMVGMVLGCSRCNMAAPWRRCTVLSLGCMQTSGQGWRESMTST